MRVWLCVLLFFFYGLCPSCNSISKWRTFCDSQKKIRSLQNLLAVYIRQRSALVYTLQWTIHCQANDLETTYVDEVPFWKCLAIWWSTANSYRFLVFKDTWNEDKTQHPSRVDEHVNSFWEYGRHARPNSWIEIRDPLHQIHSDFLVLEWLEDFEMSFQMCLSWQCDLEVLVSPELMGSRWKGTAFRVTQILLWPGLPKYVERSDFLIVQKMSEKRYSKCRWLSLEI
jgi:hypothetical protein